VSRLVLLSSVFLHSTALPSRYRKSRYSLFSYYARDVVLGGTLRHVADVRLKSWWKTRNHPAGGLDGSASQTPVVRVGTHGNAKELARDVHALATSTSLRSADADAAPLCHSSKTRRPPAAVAIELKAVISCERGDAGCAELHENARRLRRARRTSRKRGAFPP